MLDEDLESQSVGATMFPFLSVLFCTIGALVIIMVIGSLRTTVKDESVDVKLEDMKARGEKLATLDSYVRDIESALKEIGEARDDASTLITETGRKTSELDDEKAGLADMQVKGEEAVAYLEKADLARLRHSKRTVQGTVLKRWQASKGDVDAATGEREGLSRQIDSAKGALAALKKEAENPVVRFLFEEDPGGRRPVLIELGRDGVVVRSGGSPRPEGSPVPKAEAAAAGGFLDQLAASLAGPGVARYAVLFVRPEGVDLFYAAKERLDRWRVPYTAEPVEGDWELVFKGPAAAPE